MKKITSIILVFFMLCSVFSVAVYATDSAEPLEASEVSFDEADGSISAEDKASGNETADIEPDGEETSSESSAAEAEDTDTSPADESGDRPQADGLVSPAAVTANGLMSGDTVITTGTEGHQFFYGTDYYWGSNMSVALYKRGGTLADWQNGTNFYAWCASYGKSTPSERQLYLLESGKKDSNGMYYYTDEGLDSMRIDFDWALCCIRAAQEVSGHDYGSASFPKAYRWALEIAVRCKGYGSNPGLEAEKVNADSIPASAGALCASGVRYEFESLGWDSDGAYGIRTFYKTVQAIYTKADGYYKNGTNSTYHYVPRETVIARKTSGTAYSGDTLTLAKYSLEDEAGAAFTGVKAAVASGSNEGVSTSVSGSTLTVSIKKSDMPKNSDGTYADVTWKITLSATSGSTATMLLGRPVNSSGKVMTGSDAPQNIMLFSETTVSAKGSVNDSYTPNEKVNVKVAKTDTAGKKLPGMSFTLYKVSGTSLTHITDGEKRTNTSGEAVWESLSLGSYLLVENTNTGYAPYQPSNWKVTGAGEARYTTVGGKEGWLLELSPGTTNATVEAKNRTVTYGFSIKKADQNGKGVAGVRFTVSDDAGLLDTVELTTDESGMAQYEFSPKELEKFGGGAMYLKVSEISPKGQTPKDPAKWKATGGFLTPRWDASANCWCFYLDSEHPTFTLEAVNMVQKGALSVVKRPFDGDTARGEEFTFRLTSDTNPAYDKTFTVKIADGTGSARITGLDIFDEKGSYITYTLTEVTVPNRYKKEKPITFTFESEYKKNPGDATFLHEIVVENNQVPFQITVIKNSENGVREGFTFVLTDNRGNRWESISDFEGLLSFANLEVYDPKTLKPVIYTLTEKAAGKYLLPEPVVINAAEYVEKNRNPLVNAVTIDVYVDNVLKPGALVIRKTAEDVVLAGHKFAVENNLGGHWEITTDAKGEARLADLDVYEDGTYIKYTVTEIDIPVRYEPKVTKWSFTFEKALNECGSDDAEAVFEIKAENPTAKGSLTVRKTSEDGIVKGFKFRVVSSAGGEWTLTTDKNGEAELNGLPVYDKNNGLIVYTVEEIADESNARYVIPEAQEITITSEKVVSTTFAAFCNELKRMTLTVVKTNADGEKLLGAVFAVEYSKDGEKWLSLDLGSSDDVGVKGVTSSNHLSGNLFKTDADGEIKIDGLVAAYEYRLTETKAPEGYMLLPGVIAVDKVDLSTEGPIEQSLTVIDNKIPVFPETGGHGFWYVYLAFVLLGGMTFFKRFSKNALL